MESRNTPQGKTPSDLLREAAQLVRDASRAVAPALRGPVASFSGKLDEIAAIVETHGEIEAPKS